MLVTKNEILRTIAGAVFKGGQDQYTIRAAREAAAALVNGAKYGATVKDGKTIVAILDNKTLHTVICRNMIALCFNKRILN